MRPLAPQQPRLTPNYGTNKLQTVSAIPSGDCDNRNVSSLQPGCTDYTHISHDKYIEVYAGHNGTVKALLQ